MQFSSSASISCRGPVLLLTPSRGLGGGIERYVETIEWAFNSADVDYARLDLQGSGLVAHARMLFQARRLLKSRNCPIRLVLAHRALLPVAATLARYLQISGISVICHGSDVWGRRAGIRWRTESRLMAGSNVRVVAVSSFTAGALSGTCQANVLPPGLSQEWFSRLVEASAVPQKRNSQLKLTTAFRLADWRDKGLSQILDSVKALDDLDIRLTVCGNGQPPQELIKIMNANSFCTLRVGLTDRELAEELAASDLFVLATRTRSGRCPSGEGFGLVLLEAQVAGTPVVAPAYAGSQEAYVDQVTGVAPTDESTESLTRILDYVLRDPDLLARMSRDAAKWSQEYFAPKRYFSLAISRLL